MSQVIDLIGKKFNFLQVLKRGTNTNQGQTRWVCLCRCGNKVEVISSKLRSGHTKSCGCWNSEVVIKRNRDSAPHGLSNHPLWSIFSGMKDRCYNEKSATYKHYGARGIAIDKSWLDNPQLFFDEIGERPSDKYSVDRIDNSGQYEPGNVRWATPTVQANNRRTNRIITNKWGESKTLSGWAAFLGIPVGTLFDRLGKLNWTVEQALGFEAAPVKADRSTVFFTSRDGTCMTLSEWATELGIGYRTLLRRKNLGWSDTRILETKAKKVNTKYKFDGLELTVAQWAEHLGVTKKCLQSRLARHQDLSKVFMEAKYQAR